MMTKKSSRDIDSIFIKSYVYWKMNLFIVSEEREVHWKENDEI